jgi:steroid 5-alpha reductase family enzyme
LSAIQEIFSVTTAILAAFGVTMMLFTGLWIMSVVRRDASVIDFYWGPGFAVIGWIAWFTGRPDGSLLRLTILVCVTAWGLRLGWHILARHRSVEDARYAAMRERHGASWPIKSLFYVFWLQAIIQFCAASAVMLAALAPAQPSLWVILAGLIVFGAGFALEVAADRAVVHFGENPDNRGKLLTTGLHAHMRHPNYLGEIILQWGLALAVFGLTFNPLSFAGAAIMTALIVKVSGVPLLEEQFRKRPGYAEWAARTGALWPRF